eukprot:TRINITY_DN2282_c0_g1_i1.p1 TRINITY_DN2282_c0_g1~~TRINITY_DN2282_c0_g1_i1.p1  ORF type:complete len:1103 (+),score=303.15 TRINITY_DN2282_c0_g1_i1:114-3422(+)
MTAGTEGAGPVWDLSESESGDDRVMDAHGVVLSGHGDEEAAEDEEEERRACMGVQYLYDDVGELEDHLTDGVDDNEPGSSVEKPVALREWLMYTGRLLNLGVSERFRDTRAPVGTYLYAVAAKATGPCVGAPEGIVVCGDGPPGVECVALHGSRFILTGADLPPPPGSAGGAEAEAAAAADGDSGDSDSDSESDSEAALLEFINIRGGDRVGVGRVQYTSHRELGFHWEQLQNVNEDYFDMDAVPHRAAGMWVCNCPRDDLMHPAKVLECPFCGMKKPPGAANGTNGTNGTGGASGANGTNATNGTNGTNGDEKTNGTGSPPSLSSSPLLPRHADPAADPAADPVADPTAEADAAVDAASQPSAPPVTEEAHEGPSQRKHNEVTRFPESLLLVWPESADGLQNAAVRQCIAEEAGRQDAADEKWYKIVREYVSSEVEGEGPRGTNRFALRIDDGDTRGRVAEGLRAKGVAVSQLPPDDDSRQAFMKAEKKKKKKAGEPKTAAAQPQQQPQQPQQSKLQIRREDELREVVKLARELDRVRLRNDGELRFFVIDFEAFTVPPKIKFRCNIHGEEVPYECQVLKSDEALQVPCEVSVRLVRVTPDGGDVRITTTNVFHCYIQTGLLPPPMYGGAYVPEDRECRMPSSVLARHIEKTTRKYHGIPVDHTITCDRFRSRADYAGILRDLERLREVHGTDIFVSKGLNTEKACMKWLRERAEFCTEYARARADELGIARPHSPQELLGCSTFPQGDCRGDLCHRAWIQKPEQPRRFCDSCQSQGKDTTISGAFWRCEACDIDICTDCYKDKFRAVNEGREMLIVDAQSQFLPALVEGKRGVCGGVLADGSRLNEGYCYPRPEEQREVPLDAVEPELRARFSSGVLAGRGGRPCWQGEYHELRNMAGSDELAQQLWDIAELRSDLSSWGILKRKPEFFEGTEGMEAAIEDAQYQWKVSKRCSPVLKLQSVRPTAEACLKAPEPRVPHLEHRHIYSDLHWLADLAAQPKGQRDITTAMQSAAKADCVARTMIDCGEAAFWMESKCLCPFHWYSRQAFGALDRTTTEPEQLVLSSRDHKGRQDRGRVHCAARDTRALAVALGWLARYSMSG